MNKPAKTGIPRLVDATRYSWLGIKAAWRDEEAFRLEIWLSLGFIPLAFWLGDSLLHQLLLLTSCALVLIAELINSAIEAVVDRIGTEHHPLSGKAKDMGSAIVFVALLLFVLIWSLSAWHYIQA